MSEPNGKDPVQEQLNVVILQLERMEELLEELVERVTDLETPSGSGFDYEH